MDVQYQREDFIRFPASRCSRNEHMPRHLILCKWMHPPTGLVAINCDASYRASDNTGGYGVIIRDDMGRVKITKSSRFPFSCFMDEQKVSDIEYGTKVLLLEMIAIRDGLLLAKCLGFTAAEVRSDSKNAIHILVGLVPCPKECCEVVSEITAEIRFFPVLEFMFVYRECNRAADFLSRFMTSDGVKCMDYSALPQTLQRIVYEDAIGLLVERPLRNQC